MKKFAFLFLIASLSSCDVFYPIHDYPWEGEILFTSNYDCEFRIFNSDTVQIIRDVYELGKHPTSVRMKSTGVFILHAESASKSKKTSFTYGGGNVSYYIEF